VGARFRGAYLQSAHFDDAYLAEADFRDANVDDAFFRGATLDAGALSSLLLSKTWRPLSSPNTSAQEVEKLEKKIRQHLDEAEAGTLIAMAQRRRAGAGGSAP
jgi:hypothetical protein